MISRLASALSALAIATGTILALPTAAAATPTAGAIFNDPTGTRAEQYAIADRIGAAIDAAPPGAVIRMAFYSITIQSIADKLVAAHERGVRVRLLMDDHEIRPQWNQLVDALGTDHRAGSFALLCHRGCMTDYEPSYQHAKLYMFSTSGTAKRVVMVSSANPTHGQAVVGWNDAYTMIGDSTMYRAHKAYFEDMTAGALQAVQPTTKPAYYRTARSGPYKAYLSPRAGRTNASDTTYRILSNVSCSGAAPGYGTARGHTIIKVAMFQWTRYRINLAKKLWDLDNAGCSVEIVYSGHKVDSDVKAALTKQGGRFGGPVLWDASKDDDGDGRVDAYVHNKYFTVDGNYAGNASSRLVFTGSQNFANNALRYNNEILLRIRGNGPHRAYLDHFSDLRDFARSSPAALPPPQEQGPAMEDLVGAGE